MQNIAKMLFCANVFLIKNAKNVLERLKTSKRDKNINKRKKAFLLLWNA